ncbi:calcium/sodium antiporter [Peptacetobacter hominis]|uniref:Calcium/sodium antiporter n=1 Tax=Peptacetobacter hominis TaxID=2743610 RepID=A0A544QVL9_9FIRM|nr:calcium/sodium antiporter [Peptacetobacter hominis]TQQ84740.1 calcium/sodium antiporter [Peptacetobacter hominis]
MNYILLIVGFIFLVKGADFFVDGSSSIAQTLKIPSLIIGLTIVAFGTSAPEAAVSITASISGQNGMAMGNVVGSNIFNLLVVVGISAIIKPLMIEKGVRIKEFPFLILISALSFVIIADQYFNSTYINQLSRGDGIILLMFFAVFMYSLVMSALKSRNDAIENQKLHPEEYKDMNIEIDAPSKTMPIGKAIIFSIGGIIAIVLGGQLVVNSATGIAKSFGVSDQLIGLTIVAIGTSLPELVTSIIAATKGESDIALGNVIGSNVFNILFVLGISAAISPISIDPKLFIDCLFMIAVTVLAYIFSLIRKDINRLEGAVLTALYIGYTLYLISGVI